MSRYRQVMYPVRRMPPPVPFWQPLRAVPMPARAYPLAQTGRDVGPSGPNDVTPQAVENQRLVDQFREALKQITLPLIIGGIVIGIASGVGSTIGTALGTVIVDRYVVPKRRGRSS